MGFFTPNQQVDNFQTKVDSCTRPLAGQQFYPCIPDDALVQPLFGGNFVFQRREAGHITNQLLDILRAKLLKRGIEGSSLDVPENIVHSGKTWFVEAKLKQGIESATQKKIVKMIKDSKLKVQAQIQGDEIRVTGKSRDDLQAVMAMVRGGDLGQPFQFKNFRD